MENELVWLPCPFCGGDAELFEGMGEHWVMCLNCRSSAANPNSSKESAIKAWNTRPTPPVESEERPQYASQVTANATPYCEKDTCGNNSQEESEYPPSDRDEEIEELAKLLYEVATNCKDWEDIPDSKYDSGHTREYHRNKARIIINAGYARSPKPELVRFNYQEVLKVVKRPLEDGSSGTIAEVIANNICSKFALPRSVPSVEDMKIIALEKMVEGDRKVICSSIKQLQITCEAIHSFFLSSERSDITIEEILLLLEKEYCKKSVMGQPHEDYTTIKYRQAKAIINLLESKGIV